MVLDIIKNPADTPATVTINFCATYVTDKITKNARKGKCFATSNSLILNNVPKNAIKKWNNGGYPIFWPIG